MTLPKDLIRQEPCLNEWAILIGYRGSIAHGTYRPPTEPNSIDDKDVMAVCVPPIDHYIGLENFGSRGTKEIVRGEWDIVAYEVRKLIRMLAKGNPNVLSLLWLPGTYYIKVAPSGRLLIENRHLFATRYVYKSFVGYAKGQLSKMTRCEFKGYMGEKRRNLVEKHGYDTKNASHLIRLLRLGIEFLRDGEMNVLRHDASELIDIKDGLWSLEKIQKEADRLFEVAQQAYLASDLPLKPDMEKINKLCVDVVEAARNDEDRG